MQHPDMVNGASVWSMMERNLSGDASLYGPDLNSWKRWEWKIQRYQPVGAEPRSSVGMIFSSSEIWERILRTVAVKDRALAAHLSPLANDLVKRCAAVWGDLLNQYPTEVRCKEIFIRTIVNANPTAVRVRQILRELDKEERETVQREPWLGYAHSTNQCGQMFFEAYRRIKHQEYGNTAYVHEPSYNDLLKRSG